DRARHARRSRAVHRRRHGRLHLQADRSGTPVRSRRGDATPVKLALEDVTVLDLSHALAGPFATTMLADYGANVIKIEPPEGEMTRAWGPPFYGEETAYFVHLHRNKKSVAIDLKHPDGQALFFRLLETADVVVENLRVGTVARLGIDYARVRERQPLVVYCSISGF